MFLRQRAAWRRAFPHSCCCEILRLFRLGDVRSLSVRRVLRLLERWWSFGSSLMAIIHGTSAIGFTSSLQCSSFRSLSPAQRLATLGRCMMAVHMCTKSRDKRERREPKLKERSCSLRVLPPPWRLPRPCRTYFVEFGLNLSDALNLDFGELIESLGKICEVDHRPTQVGTHLL